MISGSVSPGTSRVLVNVNGVLKGSRAPRRGRFHFTLDLPARHVTIRVVALDAAGNRRFRIVRNVFGLPRAGSPKPPRPSAEDGRLAQLVRQLARGYGGTAGVYVQNLQTRRGAAWNARARFPAASTIKLAIAVEVLRTSGTVPQPGSRLYGLLRRMLVYSENEAANSLLTWLGGSTSGGSDRVNAMLRSLGIRETSMYGGYEVSTAAARPIPLRVEEQPAFGIGKHTTAYDLAKLHGAVFSAAGSRGGLLRLRGSFTPADARFLLWILAHVGDRGKLGRFLPPDGSGPAQGGLDHERPPRCGDRVLARRLVRRRRDDVERPRGRQHLRRARRARRGGCLAPLPGPAKGGVRDHGHDRRLGHARKPRMTR